MKKTVLVTALLLLAAWGWWRGSSPVPDAPTAPAPAARPVAPPITSPTHVERAAAVSTPPPAMPSSRAWTPARSESLRIETLKTLQGPQLAARQIHLERWVCEGARCDARLRFAPGANAQPGQANAAASDAFGLLQKQAEAQEVSLAMTRIAHPPEGALMELQFMPKASEPRLTLSASEIARLRADTLQEAERQRAARP